MLRCVPIPLSMANELVDKWHRHHDSNWAKKFCIGLVDGNKLVGAAICAKPVNQHVDQKMVIEVKRLVSDGTKNACSKLYAACARAAKAMGYWKIQTYILEKEPGTSLKAAGWQKVADVKGKPWTHRNGRFNNFPSTPKTRWELVLNEPFDFSSIEGFRSPEYENQVGW